MRVTITFFLLVIVLVLTYWAWTLTPSRIETHPMIGSSSRYEEVKKIMNSTDIEFLREQAIGVKFDKTAIQRDRDTFTAMTILGFTVLCTIAAIVLLFLEIGARGRKYRQKQQP